MPFSCPFRGCQNEGRPLANDHPEGPYDGIGDSRKADRRVGWGGVNAYGKPDREITIFWRLP